MDELEWLKEHSPSASPSRDITQRHRTQVRAAIAEEGAAGTRPRRPRRPRRARHRVLVTSAVVVGVCALGAGVVALASSGGDDANTANTVGAPAPTDATTAAPAAACTGSPPAQLAVPAGFGNAVAAPAAQATTAPTSGQQVTSWKSDTATIEQRWPADAKQVAQLGALPTDREMSVADRNPVVDAQGAHRTILFSLPGRASGCGVIQVTVFGGDATSVNTITDALLRAPFVSSEPLVTTTASTSGAPDVVACDGAARKDLPLAVPALATVGGTAAGNAFPQAADALRDFLAGHPTLIPHGYAELHLDDGSLVYAKTVAGNVVTTIHVVPSKGAWMVADWRASAC